MTRSKVDFLLSLLSACFPLSPPLVDFSGLMMTRMKEQSQRGQRSRSHRLAHPMLRPLPCQPRVPSLRLSLVSRHFVSSCVCVHEEFFCIQMSRLNRLCGRFCGKSACAEHRPNSSGPKGFSRRLSPDFIECLNHAGACETVFSNSRIGCGGLYVPTWLKFPGVRRCESRHGLRRWWSLLV